MGRKVYADPRSLSERGSRGPNRPGPTGLDLGRGQHQLDSISTISERGRMRACLRMMLEEPDLIEMLGLGAELARWNEFFDQLEAES